MKKTITTFFVLALTWSTIAVHAGVQEELEFRLQSLNGRVLSFETSQPVRALQQSPEVTAHLGDQYRDMAPEEVAAELQRLHPRGIMDLALVSTADNPGVLFLQTPPEPMDATYPVYLAVFKLRADGARRISSEFIPDNASLPAILLHPPLNSSTGFPAGTEVFVFRNQPAPDGQLPYPGRNPGTILTHISVDGQDKIITTRVNDNRFFDRLFVEKYKGKRWINFRFRKTDLGLESGNTVVHIGRVELVEGENNDFVIDDSEHMRIDASHFGAGNRIITLTMRGASLPLLATFPAGKPKP